MNDIEWLRKQEHFEWLQKCLSCWKITEVFIFKNIQQGKFLDTIPICRDVSEMCNQCIKFEAQRSPFFQQLCQVCAEICESCTKKIEDCDIKNDICLETIAACKSLADACRAVQKTSASYSK
jgi:hypothetical protein